MKKYFDFIISSSGRKVTTGSVSVLIYGTATPASLFSDAAGTVPIANPVPIDSRGYFEFYAADGRYSLTVNTPDFNPVTLTDIVLDDPASGADIGYTPSGAGAVATTVQAKLRESVSVKDFGAVGDGVTDDTAAIQAAVTAQQGKSLIFTDGDYKNTSIPSGINNVQCLGTPRVGFVGTPIPLFNSVFTGNNEIAIVAGVIRYYDATTTSLGHGYTNGGTVNIVAGSGSGGTATVTTISGRVDVVTLAGGGTGYINGAQAELQTADGSGRGCLVNITVSGGVITSILKRSGWYFIKDGDGSHDPVLIGPTAATGTASVILDVGLDAFGLDYNNWTPSGFVCGPDDTLAISGCTFGASVGTQSITITGSYNTPRLQYITYNGSNWTYSGDVDYSFNWVAGASAYLEVTRVSDSKAAWNHGSAPMLTMRMDNGTTAANWMTCALASVGTNSFRVTFWDKDGLNITTQNTNMRFYVFDPSTNNAAFNFAADAGASANIWIVGVFVRKPATY